MAQRSYEKARRKGITLRELHRSFPTESSAKEWLAKRRWPSGIACPHCGSLAVQVNAKHSSMPYRCREKACAKRFSVKTGTVMHGSNLNCWLWVVAAFLMTTSLKSVSSMKLHRDLGITQKSAWFLAQRIRFALESNEAPFAGPVEADETYFGGKRSRMRKSKRKALEGTGRGAVGKAAVLGIKDRASNRVAVRSVDSTDGATLQAFVKDRVAEGAQVFTDESPSYTGLPNPHEAVKHSAWEYVRGLVHVNGIESFWSELKRAHYGTFHKLSPKHLNRYAQEFAGRHNLRPLDTEDQLAAIFAGMDGKRLTYAALIAENGRQSGARPCRAASS